MACRGFFGGTGFCGGSICSCCGVDMRPIRKPVVDGSSRCGSSEAAGLRSLASGRWPQVAGLRSLGSHWTPWRTRHSESFIWCWLMRWSARWWPWCRSWRLCAGYAALVATCIGSAQHLSRLVGLCTRSEARSGSLLGGSAALGHRIAAGWHVADTVESCIKRCIRDLLYKAHRALHTWQ